MEKYYVPSNRKKAMKRPRGETPPRKRFKYTNDDDLNIALFATNNKAIKPSSSKIWKEAEKVKVGEGHTWQSMRSRFLKVIQPRLEKFAEEKLAHEKTQPRSFPPSAATEDIESEAENYPALPNWCLLTNQEIEYIFSRSNTHTVTTTEPDALEADGVVAYGPLVGVEALGDAQQTVLSVINYLRMATQQPQSVVVHALIVNSGVVRDAFEYIRNPRGK